VFVWSTPGAATSEFAINHDCGHASDAVLFCLGSHFGLLHVMDNHFMSRTGKSLH
jgi:hypothetical protein